MNCYQHPDQPATAYCRTCGRPLCADDQREIYGVIYCQECLARQLGHLPPPAAAAPGGMASAPAFAPQPNAPSPGIALLLGFIPGVGAIYNGQYLKAFVQVVVFGFLIASANSGGPYAALIGIAIAAFYFYMLVDSYRTAKAMAAGYPADDLMGGALPVNAPVSAIVLIVIGGIFLLRSLGWFHYDFDRYLWPLVLIAIGVGLLLRRGRAR